MDELIAFWKARLDEEEAAANAGARCVGMPWHAEPQPGSPGGLVIDDLGLVASTGGRYAADHIARQDPDRTLRRVAAMRVILAEYEAAYRTDLGIAIENLAAVDSDHPDYRKEWARHLPSST